MRRSRNVAIKLSGMNIIERKYRLQLLAEDWQHAVSKVDVIEDGCSSIGDKERLESLKYYLKKCIALAQRVGCPRSRQELTALLQASIDGRIEAKNLEEAMASAEETEKGHTANVTPFVNR